MKIISVEPVAEYRVLLTTDDDASREVDLWQFISWGEIYEPLRNDADFFRQVDVDPVAHTLVWPNGADIAPEILLSAMAAAN